MNHFEKSSIFCGRKSDVDYFLLQEAIACGAEYLDQTELHSIEWANGAGAKLLGQRRGQAMNIRTRLIMDASGPRGFLSRALNLRERSFAGYPATQALYSHFIGVHRCDEMPDYEVRRNRLCGEAGNNIRGDAKIFTDCKLGADSRQS